MKYLSQIKIRPALLLIVGTMIVAAPRYMEIGGFTVNFMVDTEAWKWVNFYSGIGMALIEGIAIWYTWNSWNRAEWSTPGRKPLMALIVCLLCSLAGSVWFAMLARSAGSSLTETFAPFWRGVWAACTTLAPFFVMASAGVAESVRDATEKPEIHTLQAVPPKPLTMLEAMETQIHIAAPATVEKPVSRQALWKRAQKAKQKETQDVIR